MPIGTQAAENQQEDTYIVVSTSSNANAAQLDAHGHHVVGGSEEAGVLIVRSASKAGLQAQPGVTAVVKDRIRVRVPKFDVQFADVSSSDPTTGGCAGTTSACSQQWDLNRIHVPDAWTVTRGASNVKVAIIDTGVASTHEEVVGSNYDLADSRSTVQPSTFCPDDAATFASVEDFNGHGTWTNTHVSGKNGSVMTGIAPGTTFINVRVLGACGFGFDSWVLSGMIYAGQAGASVESMSLGGFLCAGGVVPGSLYCPDQAAVGSDPQVYQAYVQVVKNLKKHGTLVVAAAGNEGVYLGPGGLVRDHSTLAFGPVANDPQNDLHGLYEVPGGVPGVIAVSAVNRVTAPAPAGSTKFGQPGSGLKDQKTYYSNYGSRVDVSAPGGARNYNVPRFDCLTATCRRLGSSTPTASDNPGDFGAWAFDGAGNPCNNCYVYIQGTSMATPQVAGVAALALSANPDMSSGELAALLRQSVTAFADRNGTPATEDDPSQPTWNYDLDYDAHGVSNHLLGTGVIDAAIAVGLGDNNGGSNG